VWKGRSPKFALEGSDLAMASLHIPAMRVAEEENATTAIRSVTTK
jgi:hypothetical protein